MAAETARHGRWARKRKRTRPTPEDVTLVEEPKLRKAVAAAAIGNTMEWFDFGVFSYITVVISQVFFPSSSPTAQLLSTFATFAVAFLVRPLGGFFFGPLGDRIGRRKVLAITMVTMAAGTFMIGLIPSYATIGIWAPVLLLVARLVQGFSTGGEYGGATTFVAEFSPDRRRGFMGSWLEFGTLLGYSLGAAVVTVLTVSLPQDDLLSWGWRIPFLLGGPLGIIGLYLRFRLEETPAFQQEDQAGGSSGGGSEQESQPRNSYREIFVDNFRPLLICVGLVLVFNVTNYMLTAYMPTYLTVVLGFSHPQSLVLVLSALLLVIGLVLRLGWRSDQWGRLPITTVGSVALVVLALPIFLLMSLGHWWAVFLGILVLGLILVCFSSTLPSTIPALFRTPVRYGGVSIGFNISVALFGGTTPLISEALIGFTGNTMSPAFLLMIAGVVGAVSVLFTRESARRSLPGSSPTAASSAEARKTARDQRRDPGADPETDHS
ncbi:MFS transporter [Saccharopolyspora rhizosphaerae]|uniref:Putative proline/betaine transporter n=1 Tax=Saccharopolyspora rhizosphaerae TaxID=2492662 RepID=A0A3R8QAZ1_9PSEU|nr:MFS transporter [Saccharopolyspora rhizosphaerae]RRO16944.1 MFS transporter [Saccharopolyspora rhizosphaerae]